MNRSIMIKLAGCCLLASTTVTTAACATGASAVAASTHGKASVYRSATAYVQLAPEQAFSTAVKFLLGRGDIKITDLKEAENRCSAVRDNHRLTLRVIESGDGRSRISILVGGGDDPIASQDLADDLVWRICARLGTKCEIRTDEP